MNTNNNNLEALLHKDITEEIKHAYYLILVNELLSEEKYSLTKIKNSHL